MNFTTQNFASMQHMMNGRREIETSQDDPIFQSLVRRRKNGEAQIPYQPIQEFPQEDIDALTDFCTKNGILGFNFGRMNPKSALMMLKNKMGIHDTQETLNRSTKQLIKG